MKKALIMVLVMFLAVMSVFAGGSSEKGATKVYQIAVMSGGAAWGQCERGFLTACEELGWDGQYLAPQTANSYTDMVNLTETAITNGADIIMPCVSDDDVFSDVLTRAQEQDIIVIGLADGSAECDTTIGTDPVNLGRNAAEALVRAVGDGPIKDELEQRCKSSRINSCIEFWGSRSDIPEFLSNSNVFLLPSLDEGLPISIIEAMRQGLATVSTNVGGIPEMVEDGKTGIIIKPSADGVRTFLMSIQHYDWTSMGKNARLLYETKFSVSCMVSNYCKVFTDVLS